MEALPHAGRLWGRLHPALGRTSERHVPLQLLFVPAKGCFTGQVVSAPKRSGPGELLQLLCAAAGHRARVSAQVTHPRDSRYTVSSVSWSIDAWARQWGGRRRQESLACKGAAVRRTRPAERGDTHHGWRRCAGEACGGWTRKGPGEGATSVQGAGIRNCVPHALCGTHSAPAPGPASRIGMCSQTECVPGAFTRLCPSSRPAPCTGCRRCHP